MSELTDVAHAFRNMLRAARRDPIWAIASLAFAPFRSIRYLFGTVITLLVVGIFLALLQMFIPMSWYYTRYAAGVLIAVFLVLLLLRMLTRPLVEHFGNVAGDTHGSARFASRKSIEPLKRESTGVMIGRDCDDRKLLRYNGPRHLITIAPTRTGKGTGTVIPNLLTANRTVLCIDPKGENARIANRRRRTFGPVFILDPFAVTGEQSANFNPLDSIDLDGLDFAEDATTLAEALIYDESGASQETHWNEEAKALIVGFILQIAAHERPGRRTLITLREYLTCAPEAFSVLLNTMQNSQAANGLIARAANRHLGKDEREARGILSTAQRHTHFLDSPRMANVLSQSNFRFADLKTRTMTVFLVLPPDRLAGYSRWLRLLVTQALTEMVRNPVQPPSPVLMLLDEFASLGRLAIIERAFGLMAGYGVQLWPILQDIHQLRVTYGKGAGTFLSNAGVLQIFGTNDQESADLVSKLLGEQTIAFETQSRNHDSEKSGLSASEQRIGRALLTADEVRRMSSDTQLLFLSGCPSIMAGKIRY